MLLFSSIRVDAASVAVIAYSGFAYTFQHIPTLETGFSFSPINEKVIEVINTYKQSFNPGFQKEQRRKFWLGWLDEAIPEACKLIS